MPKRRAVLVRRSNGAIFGDWMTWAIRIIIPGIAYLLWLAYLQLQALMIDVKVLETKIDSHGQQLTAIWQRLGQPARTP